MSFNASDFLGGLYGEKQADLPPGNVPYVPYVPSEAQAGSPANRPEAGTLAEPSAPVPLAEVPRLVELAFAEIGIPGVSARWAEPEPQADPSTPWEQCEPPGEPCPRCGGLLWWEDVAGRRRCPNCDRAKSERSDRLEAKVRRLRATARPETEQEAERRRLQRPAWRRGNRPRRLPPVASEAAGLT